jgi:glycosyltransferase involved in cell wall biosynthesis
VHVASTTSRGGARRAIARVRPRVIVVDSIAFGSVRPADLGDARVVALAHMRVAGAAARALLRRADTCVAVSDPLALQLRNAAGGRVTVIAPGSDGVPVVARRVDRGHGASATAGSDGTLRVLSVANWSSAKGIDTLVRACARVPGVRLDLVGDEGAGAYARKVRAALRPLGRRARRHGPLGPAALARIYARADVLAMPSRHEGYGIAVTEALRRGLPVVASDLAAHHATVGNAGLLVPAARVRALARALTRMRDPRLRRRLASAARRRARTLPTWAQTQRSFVAVLESELHKSRGGGDEMPPRGVKSPKRKRQYEKIKKSEMSRGRSPKVAKRIAAATTNKTRRRKGETKSSRTKS